MSISNLALLLLLGALAAPVLAQEPNATGAEGYAKQREKMLKRMEAVAPQRPPKPAAQEAPAKKSSAYGQGYGSRKETQNRPEHPDADSRPERPDIPSIDRISVGRP